MANALWFLAGVVCGVALLGAGLGRSTQTAISLTCPVCHRPFPCDPSCTVHRGASMRDVSRNAQEIDTSAGHVERADMPWTRWFAWYPVRIPGYGIVWWEWIERRPTQYRNLPEW